MNKKQHKERQKEFLNAIFIKYNDHNDKINHNIYPNGMTDKEFRDLIIKYFLGENYYIADPVSHDQSNTIIAYEIILRN